MSFKRRAFSLRKSRVAPDWRTITGIMLLVSAVGLRSMLPAAEELNNVSVRRFYVAKEAVPFEGDDYLWINPGEESPGQILSLLKNTAAETSANGWGEYVLSSNRTRAY